MTVNWRSLGAQYGGEALEGERSWYKFGSSPTDIILACLYLSLNTISTPLFAAPSNMDKITHDTELMTQYVAAQGISTTSRLIALHDENNEPMILTLGTLWKDKSAKLNRFYLLKKDAKGLYQKLDLGLQLGLEKTYDGEAIAAIQEPSSNKIYLAMGVTKGSDQGRIILLEPLSARDLVSSSLPKRIIPSSSSGTLSPVVGIYMVCKHLNCRMLVLKHL